MCLTLEALVLFLNILGPDVVTTEADAITVHAADGDVVWHPSGELWCTSQDKGPRVFNADGPEL